jgi:hypothetical protein
LAIKNPFYRANRKHPLLPHNRPHSEFTYMWERAVGSIPAQ